MPLLHILEKFVALIQRKIFKQLGGISLPFAPSFEAEWRRNYFQMTLFTLRSIPSNFRAIWSRPRDFSSDVFLRFSVLLEYLGLMVVSLDRRDVPAEFFLKLVGALCLSAKSLSAAMAFVDPSGLTELLLSISSTHAPPQGSPYNEQQRLPIIGNP